MARGAAAASDIDVEATDLNAKQFLGAQVGLKISTRRERLGRDVDLLEVRANIDSGAVAEWCAHLLQLVQIKHLFKHRLAVEAELQVNGRIAERGPSEVEGCVQARVEVKLGEVGVAHVGAARVGRVSSAVDHVAVGTSDLGLEGLHERRLEKLDLRR